MKTTFDLVTVGHFHRPHFFAGDHFSGINVGDKNNRLEAFGLSTLRGKEKRLMQEPERYMRKQPKERCLVVSRLGKVAKGVKCSVTGCGNDAVRSLPTAKVTAAGLKVGEVRRAYLCKEHYKEFKRNTKQERMLEKWRHGARG